MTDKDFQLLDQKVTLALQYLERIETQLGLLTAKAETRKRRNKAMPEPAEAPKMTEEERAAEEALNRKLIAWAKREGMQDIRNI
jgi:hypothetical protein